MDILNTKTEWIENRCYRVIPVRGSSAVNADEKYYKPLKSDFNDDESVEIDIPILHTGNRFHTTIHCPNELTRHVIGQKGKMIRIIEQKGATIEFADKAAKCLEISILGQSKDIVSATYIQIQNIIHTSRLREKFTHFISLPMNTPEIHESFIQFKEEVLSKFKRVRGINDSIFQTPNKLHVTIVPIVLLDERDIEQAEAILNQSLEAVMKDFGEKQFIVQVRGVEYMNDDPAEVDVLYAKLNEKDGDTSLQVTVDKIMKQFVEAKLANDQHEKVKLHITLMNTTFRNDDETNITFDARPILKDYIDYNFGQITISEIHISIRHTKGPDGYYRASCKKKLT